MKTFKKSLAVVLSVIMALSVFAVAAFAMDEAWADEFDFTGYVNVKVVTDTEELENGDLYMMADDYARAMSGLGATMFFGVYSADAYDALSDEEKAQKQADLLEALAAGEERLMYQADSGNVCINAATQGEAVWIFTPHEAEGEFETTEERLFAQQMAEVYEGYASHIQTWSAPAVEEGWVAIPASAEGLETGAYYLDFSASEYGDLFGSFSYLFNEEEFKLKTTGGEDFSFLLSSVLKQVGVNWVKAKLPGEAKAAGDYYVDMTASEWAPYAAVMKEVYVNTVASSVFKVRIVSVSQEYGESEVIEPLFDKAMNPDEATMYLMIANKVKLYEGGQDTPGTDDNNDNGSSGNFFTNLWAKIVAFFQKIADFFKNLFKK